MSIIGSRECYSKNNGNNSNSGNNLYSESTSKSPQVTSSGGKKVLKRGTSDTRVQQQSKRQKTTTTTENVINRHLHSNAVDNGSSINLSQKSIHIESEQISGEILKRTPLNEIAEQKITMITGNKTNQEWKVDKIKSDYEKFVSCFKYYRNVFQAEFGRMLDGVAKMDKSEVEAILDGVQGNAWWIRRNIYISSNQETYVGIIYSDGAFYGTQLLTDDDLVRFFNGKNPALHLEALRKGKLDKIKSDCALFSSFKHYRDVFREGIRGATIHEISKIDAAEVQAVLGGIKGNVWWIRKNIYGIQNAYQGVIYLNNKVNYFDLPTDDDLIAFSAQNRNSAPHLGTIRKKKLDKIKSDCALFSSSKHYQDVLQEGTRGATIHEISKIDAAEVQVALDGIQGNAWWIRKNIYGIQNAYQGVTYLNNKVNYFDLLTDDDLIAFSAQNPNPASHLEAIRKERLERKSKIKKYLAPHSSSAYYKNAYAMESQGLDDKALKLDFAEARAIPQDVSRTVWWVREGFSDHEKVYKGIYYDKRVFSSFTFSTENELIQFCEKNELLFHLENLRKVQHFGPLKDLPKQLYDVLDTQYTLENSIDERHNVLRRIVDSWLFLIDPDRIEKQLDNDPKASFQEKANLYINDEILKSLEEEEVIRILNLFQEKNK